MYAFLAYLCASGVRCSLSGEGRLMRARQVD